jgi:hypothetical protein
VKELLMPTEKEAARVPKGFSGRGGEKKNLCPLQEWNCKSPAVQPLVQLQYRLSS